MVQQLKPRPKLLHTYLDALFERDPHLGYEFHDIQIELYADYDYGKLLDFLRASNYYSLERVSKEEFMIVLHDPILITSSYTLLTRPTLFARKDN